MPPVCVFPAGVESTLGDGEYTGGGEYTGVGGEYTGGVESTLSYTL